MQKVIFSVAILWCVVFSCAEKPVAKKINWLKLSEAEAKLKQQPKPVLIDMYTDWCGWCKVMDKKTYGKDRIAQYIEEKFYPVKLDAETKETISWKDQQYKYNSAYKANEIAVYFSNGQLAFPTTVIIPDEKTGPQAIPGYIEADEFEKLLKYFGEGYYKNISFEDYLKGKTSK